MKSGQIFSSPMIAGGKTFKYRPSSPRSSTESKLVSIGEIKKKKQKYDRSSDSSFLVALPKENSKSGKIYTEKSILTQESLSEIHVVAPEDLPEGHKFEAVLNDKTYLVIVTVNTKMVDVLMPMIAMLKTLILRINWDSSPFFTNTGGSRSCAWHAPPLQKLNYS